MEEHSSTLIRMFARYFDAGAGKDIEVGGGCGETSNNWIGSSQK
jgi:hypothetical protein